MMSFGANIVRFDIHIARRERERDSVRTADQTWPQFTRLFEIVRGRNALGRRRIVVYGVMIYYGEALFSVERGRGRNKSQKGGKLICYAYTHIHFFDPLHLKSQLSFSWWILLCVSLSRVCIWKPLGDGELFFSLPDAITTVVDQSLGIIFPLFFPSSSY